MPIQAILVPTIVGFGVGVLIAAGIYFFGNSSNKPHNSSGSQYNSISMKPQIVCTYCKGSILQSPKYKLLCGHDYHLQCFLHLITNNTPYVQCSGCDYQLRTKASQEKSPIERNKVCGLCKKSLLDDKISTGLEECGHVFHTNCFSHHLSSKDTNERILCPANDCSYPVSSEILKNIKERICHLCDDMMSPYDSLILDCKHSFHKKCLVPYSIYKAVKGRLVCPVENCRKPISESTLKSALLESEDNVIKPLPPPYTVNDVSTNVAEESEDNVTQAIPPPYTVNDVSKNGEEESEDNVTQALPPPYTVNDVSKNGEEESEGEVIKPLPPPNTVIDVRKNAAEERLSNLRRRQIDSEAWHASPPRRYNYTNVKKIQHLNNSEWKSVKKCLLCRNYLSEGKTLRLDCKHTYHFSCLVERSNKARAACDENTCPLKYCLTPIPYIYGS